MKENLFGYVLWLSNSIYYVESEDKSVYKCTIKGKFMQNQKDFLNPICIGDRVTFSKIDDTSGLILSLLPRTNYFFRYFNKTGRKGKNLIGANLDQVILLISVDKPSIRTAFIDRVLSMCIIENIKPIIVVNKIDLGIKEDEKIIIDCYKYLKYDVMLCSVLKSEGIDEIKNILQDKKTLIIGQSGVGKSSFINEIFKSNLAVIGDISDKYNRGRHTTTMAKTYIYNKNTYIIDSPGLKEFSYFPYSIINISRSFREFSNYSCGFANCSHTIEDDCGVILTLEKASDSNNYDEILIYLDMRYKNYIGILEDIGYSG